MALNPTQAEQLAVLAERAKNWRATRKVPLEYREDIIQDALAEVLARETFDESLGPLEPFFRKHIEGRVARYFAAPARRQQPLSPQMEEDELGAVDAGRAELEAREFEDQVAAAAVKAFRASNASSQEAVALLAQGLGIAEVAERLGINEEAAKVRVSRFADAFKATFQPKGFGNRVNVDVVINITDNRTINNNKGTFKESVFLAGSAGRDLNNIKNANTTTNFGDVRAEDVRADHFATGAARVKADRDIPADVKAQVVERLSDIEAEAGSARPSLEVIQRALKAIEALIPPQIIEALIPPQIADEFGAIDAALIEDVGGFVDDPKAWFLTPNGEFEGRKPIELLGTSDEARLKNRIEASKLGLFS